MNASVIRQYSVFLPNKPGALSGFIKLFLDQGVNVIGIASEIRDDSGVVSVDVDSDKRIGYILTQAGFTTIETPVLSVHLPNKPGELHKLSKLLGEAGINITTVYGTAIDGQSSRVLLAVNDLIKAQEIISKLPE